MARKKFSFLEMVYDGVLKSVSVTRAGQAKLKRGDLRKTLDDAFLTGVKAGAGGERVRFPVIGALVRKDVKARKGGKGVNPFTGAEMMMKPRPATKKPRWSFPKTVKEAYANKRNW